MRGKKTNFYQNEGKNKNKLLPEWGEKQKLKQKTKTKTNFYQNAPDFPPGGAFTRTLTFNWTELDQRRNICCYTFLKASVVEHLYNQQGFG